MKWRKYGLILRPELIAPWWVSHAMAPSAVYLNSAIRVFLGCWDANGISRVGYVDLDAEDPTQVKAISDRPVLDIGRDGTFDENGVFPAHASVVGDDVYLYYTGFQLGHKIRHYNFGGLAISRDGGVTFTRVSEAPVLDRADEGLHVRAGQSVVVEKGIFRTVYSAGGGWISAGDKQRPVYDVFYQDSPDGIEYLKAGRKILACDHSVEHGLGRPQLVRTEDAYYVFYTRRMLDMKYSLGCARSSDCLSWMRLDDEIGGLAHSDEGWDSEMVYFPSVVKAGGRVFLFYSGNAFGKSGFGFAELLEW